MEMNVKQQLLLQLLGLGKKGTLEDFDAFASKNRLDFGKSASLATMLQWYGKEINNSRLKRIDQTKVKEVANIVRSVFDMADMMDCYCISPFDANYPKGLLSLTDNKNHVINPPFIFTKGSVSLLPQICVAVIGNNMMNTRTNNSLLCLFQELEQAGKTILIPLNMPGSESVIKLSLNAGVVPVLLAAGGMDIYLNSLENEYLNTLLDVLEAGGTIVTVQLPGTNLSESIKIKSLLYIAALTQNVLFCRKPSSNYENTVFESARINDLKLFVADNGVIREEDLVESMGNDVSIYKSGIKICGLSV